MRKKCNAGKSLMSTISANSAKMITESHAGIFMKLKYNYWPDHSSHIYNVYSRNEKGLV